MDSCPSVDGLPIVYFHGQCYIGFHHFRGTHRLGFPPKQKQEPGPMKVYPTENHVKPRQTM